MANNPTVSVIKIKNVNYDIKDAKCRAELEALIGSDTLAGDVDTIKEIQAFLAGIDTEDPTLFNQLKAINDRIDAIEAVSGTVDDTLSATSNNPVQNKVIKGALDGKANKSELTVTDVTGDTTKKTIQLKSGTSQTVVVEHQDISGKANKSEMTVTAGTGNNADKTTVQLKNGTSATVLTAHQDISGKADVDFSGRLMAWQATPFLLDGINKTWDGTPSTYGDEGSVYHYSDGKIRYFFSSPGLSEDENGNPISEGDVVYASNYPSENNLYYNKADSKFYRWNGVAMVAIATSSIAETDPVFVASVAYGIQQSDINTWNSKQNALTFDNTPTKSSANPVKSGGVYSALADLYDGYDSTTETLSFTFPTE